MHHDHETLIHIYLYSAIVAIATILLPSKHIYILICEIQFVEICSYSYSDILLRDPMNSVWLIMYIELWLKTKPII